MSEELSPTVEGPFRIKPHDIDATREFLSAFGMSEPENEALGVVLYCQAKGEWVSFTEDELTAFFQKAADEGRTFPFTSQFEQVHRQLFESTRRATSYAPVKATDLFMREGTFRMWFLAASGGRLIRRGDDGRWRVTELFIESVHESSPVPPPAVTS